MFIIALSLLPCSVWVSMPYTAPVHYIMNLPWQRIQQQLGPVHILNNQVLIGVILKSSTHLNTISFFPTQILISLTSDIFIFMKGWAINLVSSVSVFRVFQILSQTANIAVFRTRWDFYCLALITNVCLTMCLWRAFPQNKLMLL